MEPKFLRTGWKVDGLVMRAENESQTVASDHLVYWLYLGKLPNKNEKNKVVVPLYKTNIKLSQ